MARNRALLSFVMTLLASFFIAGAPTAALACAAPEGIALTCGGDLGCDRQESHDCDLACAQMCAAAEPSAERAVAAASPVAIYFPVVAFDWAPRFYGPDPPPPRMA